MGKKSKTKSKQTKSKSSVNASSEEIPVKLPPNALPRPKIYVPDAYANQAITLNPLASIETFGSWINIDSIFVLPKGKKRARKPEKTEYAPTCCPVCFKLAPHTCNQCQATSYCSKECQKIHWKLCHKQVCKPNPSPAPFDSDLEPFRNLKPEDFEPHEFLLLKPTGKMGTLAEICNQCLESADDIMDVPGFGHDQIQPGWFNNFHPVTKALCKKYGWTSRSFGVETMEGYHLKEDGVINMMLCDDCFLTQENQAPSYYGWACFPHWYREGKRPVRGNLILFRIQTKNRKKKEQRKNVGQKDKIMQIVTTADSDLEYEYEMHPLCKAEVAHILRDRLNNLESGQYSRRAWRHVMLQKERLISEKMNVTGPDVPFTLNFSS